MNSNRLTPLALIVPLLAGCSVLATSARDEPQEAAGEQSPQSAPPLTPQARPSKQFQLTFSDESAWLTYTKALSAPGASSLSVFSNDDDDLAISAHIMRFGNPRSAKPWTLGLGLGFDAWFVDQPSSQVYAVVVVGHAAYEFPTSFATRCSVDVAYAPEATTFDDGKHLIDVLTSFEADVSSFATAFVGYRLMEVTLDNGSDQTLEDGALAGIRLGF